MTQRSSKDVGFLLIGGRSVLGAPLTNIQETRQRLNEQIDGLGDSTDKWKPVGVRTFELSQEGFYSDGVGGLHEALEQTDPQVLMYAPVGNVIGRDFVGISGVRTVYERLPARGEFHKANATYRSDQAHEELGKSRVSAPLEARTTTGPTDTAPDDWGAASTDGGTAFLGVSALNLDGATNLTVSIRHSTDDITYADLVTFTVVTAAPFSERKEIAGTINRYTLTRHQFTGVPGAAKTATFATGLARK